MWLNIDDQSIRIPNHAQNNQLWMKWVSEHARLNGGTFTRRAGTNFKIKFNDWYTEAMRGEARRWKRDEQGRQNLLGGGGINVPNQTWMGNPSQRSRDPMDYLTPYQYKLHQIQQNAPHIDVAKTHAYASMHPQGPMQHWNAALVSPSAAQWSHQSRMGQGNPWGIY